MEESELLTFLNKEILATYKDGRQISTAEGKLEAVSQGFVKIVGDKGMIVINGENILEVIESNHFA